MPGTITLKPIEANITHNTSKVSGMDPYCTATIGNKEAKSSICYNGGKNPHWTNEALILQVENESKCLLEIKDKAMILSDSEVGLVELDVQEIESQGNISKWFPITFNNKVAGEILVEASFSSTIQADNQDSQTMPISIPTPLHQLFENPNACFLSETHLIKVQPSPTAENITGENESKSLETLSKTDESTKPTIGEASLTPVSQLFENLNTNVQEDKEPQVKDQIDPKDGEELNDETLSNLTNKATSDAFENPNESESVSETGFGDVLIIDQGVSEMPENHVRDEQATQEESSKTGLDGASNTEESRLFRGTGLNVYGSLSTIDQSEIEHPALLSMDDNLTRKRNLNVQNSE